MEAITQTGKPPLDIAAIRNDFPALRTRVNDQPLVYLDNAATTHKPKVVVDRIVQFYESENSNVHRGVHRLSQLATDAYEGARETIRKYIKARDSREIIFTSGTTESINVVAAGLGQRLAPGDEIVVSVMEHHSNIVPWQMVCERTGARLQVVPVSESGELVVEQYEQLLNDRTRIVALCHTSNALGTRNPVRRLVDAAHRLSIPVLIDAAQALPHGPVDVQQLDCDFLCFSGHKMFGPTGIGVLYGKLEALESLPPYQGGGDMIDHVSFTGTTYDDLPHRLEAGTPNIAGVIGLGAAVEYLESVGPETINIYEAELARYAMQQIGNVDGVRIIGTTEDKSPVVSFLINGVHPYDAGSVLDKLGIAVRTGHHCTQPLMERFEIPGTVRASFAFYNTMEEVDTLVRGIRRVQEVFGQ
ncbi:MAG: cysteine desulfurase [Rhodothermales bacterium]|nr:cysteine desulfurase [Rhodothermales bacterium]